MLQRSSLRNENGQAAAEFALVLPILAALVLAIAQFGIAFNNYLTITDAARAGARKAAVGRFANDPVADATAVVRASAAGLDQSQLPVTVTAAPDWATPGNEVTVTVKYPFSIDILGWTVKSGDLTSTTKERLE